MNQFVLGAVFPFMIGLVRYVRHGCRASFRALVWTPLAMAACGIWAVAPDLPRLVGWQTLYRRLADNPYANICFFHTAIDRIEVETPLYAVALIVLCAGPLLAAWREVALREQNT